VVQVLEQMVVGKTVVLVLVLLLQVLPFVVAAAVLPHTAVTLVVALRRMQQQSQTRGVVAVVLTQIPLLVRVVVVL
jgi:hypothetical protein